jgi:hypothetical protein
MSQDQYRKRRRDAGVLQITDRDLTALSFIGQQYCLTFDHLQTLLAFHSPATDVEALSVGATRNALERWLQLGYIEPPRKILRGYPVTVWLSRKGLKELQIPYPYYLPNPTSIPHFYAVTSVRLHMHQFDTSTQWGAQRALTKETDFRPLPDAQFHPPALPLVAIQVLGRLTSPVMLPNEINTLLQLVERRNDQNQPFYAHLWYFLHHSIFEPFQDAMTALDPHIQQRVILYHLDTQQQKRTSSILKTSHNEQA